MVVAVWIAHLSAALAMGAPLSRASPGGARVDALFAHLDQCIPEAGFPNGSRRFLLTDQSYDRNDGDDRLRLWLPPSGSLLSAPLRIDDAARLECAVGCEFFDTVWPAEGSGLPRPQGARVVTDFAIEWVAADGAANTLTLAERRVTFDPQSAPDGRVRIDVAVDFPKPAVGAGRVRFRATRIEGPAGDLSMLPTLWGPRVVHAVQEFPRERPLPPFVLDEVAVDLLDPRFHGSVAASSTSSAPVELGTTTWVELDGAKREWSRASEPLRRPPVAVEAHFQTGAGNELPRGGARASLALAAGGTLRFQLSGEEVAAGARLVFEPGFFQFAGVDGETFAAARARWRVTLDGREFAAGELPAPLLHAECGWGERVDVALPASSSADLHELQFAVELSDYASPVDLVESRETTTAGATRERRFRLLRPWFGLGRPRIVRARSIARVAASPVAPNVLFVCVETLRADEVGFGSGTRETTPFLARVAPRSLVFAQATSPAPWTLPSVASYLTALHPYEHGARSELDDVLPDRLTTLAEIAAARGGARTFGCVTNNLLRRESGFDAGFDVFASFAYANAAAVRRLFLDWQSEEPGARFFAYLHLFEPHVPLNAPGWMREAFVPQELRGLPYAMQESAPKQSMRRTGDARAAPGANDALEFLRGRYRGEIRWVDSQFELLFAELARRGLLDKTVVIVTGDHGEEFGEHRWLGHGSQLFEESIHVPLLLHGPRIPAGSIDTPVESLLASRIAASLLGAADFGSSELPAPSWPLSCARLRDELADAPVVSMTEKLIDVQTPGWPADDDGFVARIAPRPGRVIRIGDSKAILTRPVGRGLAPPGGGDAIDFFDLARDPGESTATRIAWSDGLAGRFALFAARLATERRLDASLPTQEAAADVREILRKLGYLQGGTGDR